MKAIKATYVIEDIIEGDRLLEEIEKYGRTAYKSEGEIKEGSARQFVRMILERGHESVLEHAKITVRIFCDRGVSHEIVRHRLASYTQESTRYCNYGGNKFHNEITVIEPIFWDQNNLQDKQKYETWKRAIEASENAYMQLIKLGASPQEARSVLPNSLKTEIVVTMNLREWRHFFKLRTTESAHPQMREISRPLLEEFRQLVPVVFDDIIF